MCILMSLEIIFVVRYVTVTTLSFVRTHPFIGGQCERGDQPQHLGSCGLFLDPGVRNFTTILQRVPPPG